MEPIAVIGISTLFPGAQTPAEFWDNLLTGKDSRIAASESQMGCDPGKFYEPKKGVEDRFYCLQGGYIHDFSLDPDGFELPAESISGLDDVYRWSLYVAREALRNSGYLAERKVLERCGVVLGNLSFPTKSSNRHFMPIYGKVLGPVIGELLGRNEFTLKDALDPLEPDPDCAGISGMPATLIAEALGLKGPGFALDAACASSLYSVALSCQYLNCRKADLMLAGAVSAADPFFINMGFSIFQAFPENDISRPLDQHSAGLFAAEGAGMFVLKRLSDAIRENDRIEAVIHGFGWSNDGRGQFVLSPNPKGQQLAFERAYSDSDVNPGAIDYIECHATGTPLGDKVELNSIESFFERHGETPYIGSVKSNLGHMLTAAGMGGMTKVILALQHGRIPATINVKTPMESEGGTVSGNLIIRETAEWPHAKPERRAAVNAFGFGGTNAHLIFENIGDPATRTIAAGQTNPEKNRAPLPMAIIGMDAIFGPCNGLDELYDTIHSGKSHFQQLPNTRWKGFEKYPDAFGKTGFHPDALKGAWLKEFKIDFMRFKMPPNPKERLIPQQLLLMEVTDRALRRTQLQPGQNVAVLVAMETELELHRFRGRINLEEQIAASLENTGILLTEDEQQSLTDMVKDSLLHSVPVNQFTSFIGNIMASRISSLWDFSGPAFSISAEENSLSRALETAQLLLENENVEAVVVSAVDLAGSPEHVYLRQKEFPPHSGAGVFAFDQQVEGWLPGEGAGTVIVQSMNQAETAGNTVLATIDSIQFSRGINVESVSEAAHAAMKTADIQPQDISLLELSASGIPEEDLVEIGGLSQVYGGSHENREQRTLPGYAVGSIKANIGHTSAASGMAALIKTTLCLRHRIMPAVPEWRGACKELKNKDSFYVPDETQPWLAARDRQSFKAAINVLGRDRVCSHMILSEYPRKPEIAMPANSGPWMLLPLSGNGEKELLSRLEDASNSLKSSDNPQRVLRDAFEHFRDHSGTHSLTLIGSGTEELLDEIAEAKSGIPRAFSLNTEWLSSCGSAFSPNPLGGKGKVAFVYPGGFNSYLGNGRTIFEMDPGLHERIGAFTSNLAQLLHESRLFPRTLEQLTEEKQRKLQEEFINTPIAMFESGITFTAMTTRMLRQGFRVEPHAAFGYSMGEVSMLFSLGVWGNMDPMAKILKTSPLFLERLAGPMKTIRDAWTIKNDEFQEQPLWGWFTLKTSPDLAEELLRNEDRVYLSLINTPNEVVIAGEPSACEKVIRQLDCEFHPISVTDVVHCEPVKSDYEEIKRVHTNQVVSKPKIDFFSAADYATTELDSETLADNIARIYGRTVDFPRLIEKVYEQGSRIFVDLGPRVSCARWISETLEKRPHLALGINRKGVDDRLMILRALAQLITHQVPLDMQPLFPELPTKTGKQLLQVITLGGTPVQSVLTEENKNRFSQAPTQPIPKPSPTDLDKTNAQHQVVRNGIHDPKNPLTKSVHNEPLAGQQPFPGNLSQSLNAAHSAFLLMRRQGMRDIARMISDHQQQISKFGYNTNADGNNRIKYAVQNQKDPGVIFDEQDLREFAGGKVANVFGPEYAEIDAFTRCVRLPMDPYLLVSRVTRLNAKRGEFKPSTITTEYDIPHNAWFCTDGQIPWAVAVESGQCDLLLISYLGIDFECRGEQVYRLLDCTLTYLDDMPKEGQTLRYEISINSFARHDKNLLFFFNYKCFVEEKMVLRMDNGCAGFFSDHDLEQGRGVIRSKEELQIRKEAMKVEFHPLLLCMRNSFDRNDLLELSRGNTAGCFGTGYEQPGRNPSLKTAPDALLMTDRIVTIDRHGGPWGLGEVFAEKDLAPDHWYFPCHFKDDPVLAGSLMAEGCVQLLQIYMLYLGLQTRVTDATFQPIHGVPQIVRCRGQVIPGDPLMSYRMVVKEIRAEPIPYAIADIDILVGERIVVDFRDLGVQMVERNSSERISLKQLEELRKSVDHKTERGQSAPDKIRPDDSRKEQGWLADEAQIHEFALGDVTRCFGKEYDIYSGRPVQRNPNGDLQLLSRVLSFSGARHRFEQPMRIVSEYDVPGNAWFFNGNSHPDQMPYSVLMEIALQPCGFISAYSGAILMYPDLNLHYRNLDGNGTLLSIPDLKGSKITAEIELKSTVASGNTIIQTHQFLLKCGSDPFYRGDTVFGYFTDEALENQVGLDGGKEVHPWLEQHQNFNVTRYDLKSGIAPELTGPDQDMPYWRICVEKLGFLDEIHVVADGGVHGCGYVYGDKTVIPDDWFFPCHFHQDPVMPGSLGVEAIIQALQAFAIDQKMEQSFRNPHFKWVLGKTKWKYRGQIIPSTKLMRLEVHIKQVLRNTEQVTLSADASLWRDELRIYEISDLTIGIEESLKQS